jgi:DNA-binding transcriptional ArsR family regulator
VLPKPRATADSPSPGDTEPDAFDAIADPHRRMILRLLGERERSVGELATVLPISRPAVSRHLRVLRTAGLVREEPRGTRRIYALQADGPDAVRSYLEQVWGEAAARYRLVAENARERRR